MKTKYIKPELDIITIDIEDIVHTSTEGWTPEVSECENDHEHW